MATRTLPRSDTVTHWLDEDGVVHICESDAPLDNELLVWTLCDREVESGKAFVPLRHDRATCSKCAAAEGVLKRRATPAHAWPISR